MTTQLLRGEAVQAIAENPRAVQAASLSAVKSNAGGDLLALQKILSLRATKMTLRYAHLSPNYLAAQMGILNTITSPFSCPSQAPERANGGQAETKGAKLKLPRSAAKSTRRIKEGERRQMAATAAKTG